MSGLEILLVAAFSWLAAVAAARAVVLPWLLRGPGGSPVFGMLWRSARVYGRVWHRARYEGAEVLRAAAGAAADGGLLVVSNHTGAVDPVLIQAGCPFLIRWMMAASMMGEGLAALWRQLETIPVDRDGRDSGPLREAIRHVKGGGVIGIFPEGRITMPPCEIRPFLPGAGLIVARTRAPVLLVWISETPKTNQLAEGFATRSRARIRFVDLVRYEGKPDAHAVIADLRGRLAVVSGWPLNDEVLPPGGAEAG